MSDLLRMTGMYSGMDTESIIASLVSAKQTKVTKLKGEQTKLEWKQTAWQDLNKKIYSLYSSTLSKLRLTGAYKKKKTTCSDPTKATIVAGDTAVEGTQTLMINKTAKSGYLTGAEIKHTKVREEPLTDDDGNIVKDENGKTIYKEVVYDSPLTLSSAMSEINSGIIGNTLTVTVGTGENAKTTEIEIKDEKNEKGETTPMTINKFLSKLREAGINASFDEENQRFFFASKGTGMENEFTIKDSSATNSTLKALGVDDNNYMYGSVLSYNQSDRIKGTDSIENVLGSLNGQSQKINVRVGTRSHTINQNGTNKTYITDGEDFEITVDASTTIDQFVNKLKNIGVDCEYNEASQRFEIKGDKKMVLSQGQGNGANGITDDQIEKLGLNTLNKEGGIQVGATLFKDNPPPRRLNGSEKIADLDDRTVPPNYSLVGKTIEVTVGSGDNAKTRKIKITDTMTLTDFTKEMNKAGIQGSFNNASQRFVFSTNQELSIQVKDASGNVESDPSNSLKVLGLEGELTKSDNECTRIAASDAEIVLNGATFTSSSNAIAVNGLTVNVLAKTEEEIQFTTTTDYDGIYDTIKDFFSEYNELINEIDKLYNADSARKYDMLTQEQKEAMSDEEIEKWEGTIKASLLRKDNSLSTVMNSLVEMMMGGFYTNPLTDEKKEALIDEYAEEMKLTPAQKKALSDEQKENIYNIWYAKNGNKKYLSDYGIKTLNYFEAKDNERHAYHIDGDEDDEATGTKQNKLKAAIADDPEGTAEFFAGLCKNMYDTLGKLMERTDYSSMYKVYNDRQMTKEYENYTKKIKEAEKELSAYEDKWYKKFSAMEVALSKLQSNSNAVTSMLG